MSGKLYLVPTPIGNLKDITFRAIEVLQQADLILAEDTRTSKILLQHYQINTSLQSYHMHNEHLNAEHYAKQVANGKIIAVISDAGSPGISDPGYLLCKTCIDMGLEVEALPGATAFVPAITASGLPSNEFVFVGFLPVKKGRKKKIESLTEENRTMIFYESPHKINTTIKDLSTAFSPNRRACLCREISKKFEEKIRGTLQEIQSISDNRKLKGEMVLVVDGKKM